MESEKLNCGVLRRVLIRYIGILLLFFFFYRSLYRHRLFSITRFHIFFE